MPNNGETLDMNNKTFALFMLLVGLALSVAGVGIAISSMNQAIDSPFYTNVNSTWNTEAVAIVTAIVGIIMVLYGILILF